MNDLQRPQLSGNLGDIVTRNAPDGGCIDLDSGDSLSSFELDDRAARFAFEMVGQGFERGDRIALIGRNRTSFLIAYLGLMRAGMVAVPVNYRLPHETIRFIVADSGTKVVLADPEWRDLPLGVPSGGLDDVPSQSSPRGLPVRPEADEIAEILYTSGSTGRPKGVPLSHRGQLWALHQFCRISPPAPHRTIIAAPMYHMNGLFFSTVCLALGYQAVLMPIFDAAAYLRAAAGHRCTILSGVPSMFALMAREEALLRSLDLSSVTDVIIGSAPLTQGLIDRVRSIFPNASVRNSYGTTETGPAMFGPHPNGLPRPPLSLGYPYPGVELRLRDGASPDEGELEARTPATLASYWNLPDLSAAKLRHGWYRTGDVVCRDTQGFFQFIGRVDDMFTCGGENVFPGEIERLLERHEDVLQAAVVGVEDEIKGTIPIAFVVPAPGRSIDPEELKRFSLALGPAYAHPRAVIALREMPLAGTHKIDRQALAEQARTIVQSLRRNDRKPNEAHN